MPHSCALRYFVRYRPVTNYIYNVQVGNFGNLIAQFIHLPLCKKAYTTGRAVFKNNRELISSGI